jgi:predicted acyl esterase
MRFAAFLSALCVAVALAVPAAAAPAEIETTKGVTKPDFPEQLTEEYRVETEHGTMYGWVTRPDPDAYPDLYADGQGSEGAGVPVVLVLSPYNTLNQPVEELPHALASSTQNFFAPRGYAYAQFDVVGTRESGGCYDYGGVRERETGKAVIDFLGSQDWSNGNVGMIGGSYDGTTQIAAAIEQPEHLKAIIPQVAIDRWYDYAYGGGIRYLLNSEEPTDEGFDTPFAFDFGFGIIPPTSAEPASAPVLAERINPCDRIEHTERGYEADPVYDEFWLERDYRQHADKIQAATFIEAGWLDHNVKHWDSTQLWESLPADLPKKLVMGQWPHSSSQFEDAENMYHAWFDEWLLGFDTGVMDLPPVDT